MRSLYAAIQQHRLLAAAAAFVTICAARSGSAASCASRRAQRAAAGVFSLLPLRPRARPRDRHIHQASLFFQTLVLVQTVLVREQPLFQSCDEHGMEFQPLG